MVLFMQSDILYPVQTILIIVQLEFAGDASFCNDIANVSNLNFLKLQS